jgi:hypothetical protein
VCSTRTGTVNDQTAIDRVNESDRDVSNNFEENAGASRIKEPPLKVTKLSRAIYLTLMPMAVTASASTTWWISVPCLTTTKCSFTSGFEGVWSTAAPVQSGLTV